MVDSITSLGRNGLSGWLLQRVSAVLLGIYALILVCFIQCHPQLSYEAWHGLFNHLWMKVATLVILLSLLAHAWVGIWTVITDYIKCSCGRLILEVALVLGLLGLMFWGFIILF